MDVVLNPVDPGDSPRLELAGIGAKLEAIGDAMQIAAVFAPSGAAEAGLKAGDLILAVDGVPVTALGYDGALQIIRGPENSEVLLRVRRTPAGTVEDILVTRGKIRY